jgi:glucosamine-6-phosphate deaminase
LITRQYGQMEVGVYDSSAAVGRAAAADLVRILRQAISERGETAIIVATGNSQLTFMDALRGESGIAWDRVSIFHMDEYLGMPEEHPASFRRFIREKLADPVEARQFYGIRGDADDVEAEMERYTRLLTEHRPVACVLGIGENGHLAFNDPPADFAAARTMMPVTLAESARRQQVGEGHFATLADVPTQALTLTIPALLAPLHVLGVVPEARKAEAVQRALEGPVTPDCPASILRTRSNVRLYLDSDSAFHLAGIAQAFSEDTLQDDFGVRNVP